MAETTELAVERPDSCEISVNAKGEISYKLKIYAEELKFAVMRVQAIKEEMDVWVETQKAKNGPKH